MYLGTVSHTISGQVTGVSLFPYLLPIIVPLLNFQVLPLITVLAASSCRSRLADFVGKLVVQTSSSSSIVISLSYTMIVYQLFALGLLFLRFKSSYAGVIRWSLFYLVVNYVKYNNNIIMLMVCSCMYIVNSVDVFNRYTYVNVYVTLYVNAYCVEVYLNESHYMHVSKVSLWSIPQ